MCVILPGCANPTDAGVWWRDDATWCQYSAQLQNQIRRGLADRLQSIDLGQIVSATHPEGWHYKVDLVVMKQIAVRTGQERPVMVIDPPISRRARSAAPPGQAVHYRDTHGNMQQYPQDVATALIEGIRSHSQRNILVQDGQSGRHFIFDLETMHQYVVDYFNGGIPVLSNLAPVEVVVEIPWDPTAMASMAMKADKCMRRKRYTRDESLDAILPIKAHPRTILSKSTSSKCEPGNPLYEKFVDSLEAELETRPKEVFGAVIHQASMTELSTNGPLQMAFKLAKPLRRATPQVSEVSVSEGSAFWTSMAAPVAAANAVLYGCAVQLKLLAYLVILPAVHVVRTYASSDFGDRCSESIQVHRYEHRLRVAEVTVT